MENQLQCPVCTLFLHVGMSLEHHLETHPKEQVIKALVALTTQRNATVMNNTPNEFSYCFNGQNRSNNLSYLHHQQPQQNLVIVKSSGNTQYFQRRRTTVAHHNNEIPEYVPITHLRSIKNGGNNVHVVSSRPYPFMATHMPPPSTLTSTDLCYDNYDIESPENYVIKSTYDRNQNNFDESENGPNNENEDIKEQIENREDDNDGDFPSDEALNNYDDCLTEFDEDENSLNGKPIAAKYYEKDNGDFILQESPRAYVEYTEKEDGEFLVTEKVLCTPVGVVHFKKDQEELLALEQETEKDKILVETDSKILGGCNKKSPYGLKVLSNVKVTPEMLSTGMKEIIITANSMIENKKRELLNDSIPNNDNISIKNGIEDEIIVNNLNATNSVTASVIRAHTSDIDRNNKKELPCNVQNEKPLEINSETEENTEEGELQKKIDAPASVIKLASPNNSSASREHCLPFIHRPNKRPFFNRTPKKIVIKFKKPFIPIVDVDENNSIEIIDEEIRETPIKKNNEEARSQLNNAKQEIEKKTEDSISIKSGSSQSPKDKYRKEKPYKYKSSFYEDEILGEIPRIKHHKKKNHLLAHEYKSSSSPKSPRGSKSIYNENSKSKPINENLESVISTKTVTNLLISDDVMPDLSSNSVFDTKITDPEDLSNFNNSESKRILIIGNEKPGKTIEIIDVKKDRTSSILNERKPKFTILNISDESSKTTSSAEFKSKYIDRHSDFPSEQENNNWNHFSNVPSSSDQAAKMSINNVKIESWTSHLTSALETVQSQNDEFHRHSPAPRFPLKEKAKTETITKHTSDVGQAGPSRLDYGFTNFLSNYHDPEPDSFLNSNERKFVEFMDDGPTWTRHPFSPQYSQFESDRNSYMDLDQCKINKNYNRTQSTESLNIRTDEKMPAKGEISEQESNGEIENGPWSQQIYPYQHDSTHKYSNVYDSATKEGWNLINETHDPLHHKSLQNISKFSAIRSNDQETKPFASTISKNSKNSKISKNSKSSKISKVKTNNKIESQRKTRSYRCKECPVVFTTLKAKRAHVLTTHTPPLIKTHGNSYNVATQIKPTICFPKMEIENSFDLKSTLSKISAEMKKKTLLMDYNELKKELSETSAIVVSENAKPKKRRIYVCAKCKAEFTNIKTFDHHLSIHPAECQQCGRLFRHWTNLSIHLKRHLGIKNYACRCGKRFVLRQKLVEHMRIHTGSAPISCTDCPQKFRRYSNLIQHRNRHHLNIKPELKDFVCHCGEVLHTKAKFAWHKEIHDKKPKGCPYCRERFIHQNSLTRHIRLSHSEKYPFYQSQAMECPICNKTYLKTSMKIHINIHKIKTEFKCNICNKAFSTKWNLKQHRWIHACRSTKPFKCKSCSSAFIRETDYKTHMNIHKSIKPFTCDFCGCQFSRKYNWLRHTREHETPKRHNCSICDKTFHRAYYLTEHLRVHSGERPFSCNICGKTSATKTNHNKHIKIHHARDPLTAEG